MLGIIGLLLGLATLILLVFKKTPTALAVVGASLVAGILNGVEPWTALNSLERGTGNTFAAYLFVFFLATVYGELMSATGCANTIANTFIKIFGKKNVVMIISLTTGLLVYGGVTAMVVCFTVAPIGISLLKETNISKRFLPAIISLGMCTFALTALPGTPQLNNIIPTEALGTTSTAAPVLGLIAAAIMFGLGLVYLQMVVNKSIKNGETFDDSTVKPGSYEVIDPNKCPSAVQSFLPLVILMASYRIFETYGLFGYVFAEHGAYSAVSTAMFLAVAYLVVLGYVRKDGTKTMATLKKGAVDWIMPLLNFSMIVGFGSVIKITEGFAELTRLALSIPGPAYVSAAISVCLLAGVTGSASGGMKIAISSEALVNSWLNSGVNLNALHRILSVSSCGLDSLPHCGGILATLNVCNETHSSSYKEIFVVTVIIPIIATAVIVALACAGLTF